MAVLDQFQLHGRVCAITGGAGFLGKRHAEAILEAGGIPILLDIDGKRLTHVVRDLEKNPESTAVGWKTDITKRISLEDAKKRILGRFGRIDILINNASNNPKVESSFKRRHWSRLESFPAKVWEDDLAVGLTGAFFASQVFGTHFAKKGRGVILNISSDLGVVAPDQRIYRKSGLAPDQQIVKPVSYSVVKHGLIGLTKYLATYWADAGVRINALCPGGVYNGQDAAFVKKLTSLIPMGRMARVDEYKAAILFLVSDASSYMTGSTVIMDGGRTSW